MIQIKRFYEIMVVLLILGGIGGCSQNPVVAEIDGVKVSYDELKQSVGENIPDSISVKDYVMNKLNTLIDTKLFVKDAIEKNYYNLPEVEKDIKKVEKGSYISFARKTEVFDKIKPTEIELRRGYEELKKEVTVKVLVVKDKKLADSLRHLLDKKVNFDTLIAKFSIFARRPVIGPLPLLYVPKEFKNYAKRLKKGEYTPVIKYTVNKDTTYWIMEVLDRKERKVRKYKFEKYDIQKYFEKVKYQKFNQKFTDKYLKLANLKINEKLVDSLASMKLYEIPKTMREDIVAEYRGKKLRVKNVIPILVKMPAYVTKEVKYKTIIDDIETDVIYQMVKEKYKNNKEFQDFFRIQKDNVLYSRYLEREIKSKISIDSTEMKNYYKTHIDEFTIPEKRNLQVIKTISAEKINKAYTELKQGRRFEDVARDYSEDQSKNRGGSIGWVRKDKIGEDEILKIGFALSKNAFSEPKKIGNEWVIVKCTDISPKTVRDFQSSARRIKNRIEIDKFEKMKETKLKELKNKYNVKINKKEVNKLIKELNK